MSLCLFANSIWLQVPYNFFLTIAQRSLFLSLDALETYLVVSERVISFTGSSYSVRSSGFVLLFVCIRRDGIMSYRTGFYIIQWHTSSCITLLSAIFFANHQPSSFLIISSSLLCAPYCAAPSQVPHIGWTTSSGTDLSLTRCACCLLRKYQVLLFIVLHERYPHILYFGAVSLICIG